MKAFLGIGLAFALALPALAQDKESDRVESAGKVMQEILDAPDSIPKSVLDKAECVVILPSVLKFSFGLGSSYGRGVMTCRSGKSFHGSWSAHVFHNAVPVPDCARGLHASLEKASPLNASKN
jgi:lipid-binding SYLF domain-containing protein